MTDIYVRTPSSGHAKTIWIAIGTIAVLALALWLFIGSPEEDEMETGSGDDTEHLLEEGTPTEDTEARHTISATQGDSDSALQYLTEAKTRLASGDLLGARQAAYQVLAASRDARTVSSAQQLIGDIHTQLVFSPRQMPEKEDYIIQRGDSLARIAKNFNTTIELLQKSNNLQGSLIRGGDRLRILKGEFSITVDKSDNILDVFLNGKFFKRYRVGTGKFAKTPVGEFTINDRIAQPTWWRPDGKAIPFGDPENLLGTHWLSLNIRGYGIHGTWEPDTIGKQASAGCVRLLNEDIAELFALVPLGTPVTITD